MSVTSPVFESIEKEDASPLVASEYVMKGLAIPLVSLLVASAV